MKLAVAAFLFSAAPVAAQDTAPPGPVTVSGSVALVSDYRFRGVSRSGAKPAVQGGVAIDHRSGFHAGAWASSLAGKGTFLELDLTGGYTHPLGGGTIDVGLTWYLFPGGAARTDVAEPYARVDGTIGPATLLAGIAYAPRQDALGIAAATPFGRGRSADNLYLWSDASVGIPTSPITVRAHLGRSAGNPGHDISDTSVAPTGRNWDWMLGADYVLGPITLGIAYVDTDLGKRDTANLLADLRSATDGGSTVGAQIEMARLV